MTGRQNRLPGWQFCQCIDAIRILYCDLLASPAARDVDWSYWFDSARELEATHPTMARQLTPEELSYLKERKAEGPMNQVRHAHRDLLVRFASEIRRRGYAYRTEQSYEQWVCRFILFCGDSEPESNGAAEVRSFLNYLSIQREVSSSTQNQALSALVFLYNQVLGRELGELEAFVRASLHIAPVSGMQAQDRCSWTPLWSESHSRSYDLSEEQVQGCLDKPGPG
jgi:hypothetical protein